jgi:hypothetical protein
LYIGVSLMVRAWAVRTKEVETASKRADFMIEWIIR